MIFLKQSLSNFGLSETHKLQAIIHNTCQRCGAIIQQDWIDDYFRLYCKDCEAFGRIVEGDVLFRYHRPLIKKNHLLKLEFELSNEQIKASQYLLNSVISQHIGYLYAVCGAGKTEILYETIFHFLQKNQVICFSIPRTDVVIELSKRLTKIFPNTVIKPLYNKEKDDSLADIVVSTVHQLIQYYEEFDLLILDEADAFPYKSNDLLTRLVKRALKPDGAFIMMSATYENHELKAIDKKNLPIYQLPARYHQHQLDTFTIIYVDEVMKMNQSITIHNDILQWIISKLNASIQLMLFVPTIAIGTLLEQSLKRHGLNCLNVSSVDHHRAMKINQFRANKTPILITTTLLERGITIKGVHIGIIDASHVVFNRHTLIQIAGRVGRHKASPSGEIVLFTRRMNIEIKAAKKYIQLMNKEAYNRGLINNDL
ncbi:MAG: hypothetical protein CVV56_05925 [Tenericutes bacterium HGW-Tenericutes-1]|nr:MAG: hypothetical protein CVV56_05925 [Tenericutes bacterium HGW-Tenericutes-1]